jgi:hypothetical protein
MVDVKITPELIDDLNSMLSDFRLFMSLNLIHADKGHSGDIHEHILKLIRFSSVNCKKLDIITTPTSQNIIKNTDAVSKNLLNITTFLYNYLNYAEPIIKALSEPVGKTPLPTRLSRIESLKKQYADFMKKYF